jgi:predicted N-acyltransferase
LSATEVRRDEEPGTRSAPEAAPTIESLCARELTSIPAETWDALIHPGSVPLKHGFLRAWEQSDLRGLQSSPVVAYGRESSRPIAACPGYFYDLDMPTVRLPQSAPLVNLIRRAWPDFLYARTYEVGSPTPLTNPFLVTDPGLRPAAVPVLIEAAVQEGDSSGADFILVQNFTSRSGPAGEELSRRNFTGVAIPPTAVVDVPYSSFEEYLGAMRAQYRRRAQQTLKRSASLSVEHVHDFGELADELARLWRAIFDRAREVKREVLTPAFFRIVAELEEASVLLTRREDGSIASFGLLLDDSPWLSFLQCGFEERGREEGAYFRLLYEIVRLGIEQGFEQVDLGITTIKPKLDVGAVPVPLFAWIKHRNPIFQRAIMALGEAVRPEDVEPRNVFKEAPPSPEELVRRRGLLI